LSIRETIRDVSVVGIGRVVLTSREHKSNCCQQQ